MSGARGHAQQNRIALILDLQAQQAGCVRHDVSQGDGTAPTLLRRPPYLCRHLSTLRCCAVVDGPLMSSREARHHRLWANNARTVLAPRPRNRSTHGRGTARLRHSLRAFRGLGGKRRIGFVQDDTAPVHLVEHTELLRGPSVRFAGSQGGGRLRPQRSWRRQPPQPGSTTLHED